MKYGIHTGKRFALLIIFTVLVLYGCGSSGEVPEGTGDTVMGQYSDEEEYAVDAVPENDWVAVQPEGEAAEGYRITIYDKEGKVFYEQEGIPVEPVITDLTDDIIGISTSAGNPVLYVYYYDKKNCRISDVFFNPILINNKYIAYWEDGGLMISDIFKEGLLNKRLIRDFTPTANPIDAVISIEMLEEKDLVIRYYAGEDYEERAEIIPCVD